MRRRTLSLVPLFALLLASAALADDNRMRDPWQERYKQKYGRAPESGSRKEEAREKRKQKDDKEARKQKQDKEKEQQDTRVE